MKCFFAFCIFLGGMFLFIVASGAGEPAIDPKELPRVPPVEATNALKTFQIKKGFHLELVAAEPLVMDPIAMSFDENGRLFVVEMRDYSERRDAHPHLGRIRMLEDTNGDGIFDKATIYADDLPWPTGVFCYGGGVFVAATPDIIYLKDTKGDGKADLRKTVFTGFGAGKEDKLNVQALFNSFMWGLDNRIHGVTGGNGGLVVAVDGDTSPLIPLPGRGGEGRRSDTSPLSGVPGRPTVAVGAMAGGGGEGGRSDKPKTAPLELRSRDFNFDPRTLEIRAEAGGGQYGMCFDNRGRRFVCSNSHHIQVFMYDEDYAGRNRFYHMPPSLVDIPVDGPAAEVFRISPDEMWRVVRTKWRVTGQVPGLIEGGGRASGYFTSASGITIFRGNGWPEEHLGDAFIAECGNNLVHHKIVRPDGAGLLAERPPDEQKAEFLASTDIWFRPVQMANAPDGTLYIADMYREVIEHPWSLPESMKKLLDLNAGNDRGRIYRVVPDGYQQPKPSRLGKASTKELVATLAHPNGWHRDTAARLLYERQDKSAAPMLVRFIHDSKSSLGRMHALHALDGQGALTEMIVLTALSDPDAVVREHAVKLSEKFFGGGVPSAKLLTCLQGMANDPDIHVRYQLAFTLGEIKGLAKTAPLAAIARRDFDSVWTQAAILSSLAEGAGALFAELSAETNFAGSEAGQNFLRELVVLVGAKNDALEIARVLGFIGQANQAGLKFAMVRALGDGLHRAGGSLANLGGPVDECLAMAGKAAVDENVPEAVRVEAAQLLGFASFAEFGPALLSLLDLRQPQPLQLAALSSLSRFSDPQVALELIRRWDTLTPRLRSQAMPILLARAERAKTLLMAIEAGTILASALDSTQTRFLRNHRDLAVRELAEKVLAAKPGNNRQQVIDVFMPALDLKGDVVHGKKIYEERCLSCHRLGGEGSGLGPDLVTVKTTGKEKILVNILDPNREVRPEYVSYLVETKDGESLIGLIVNETATTLTLRQAYGKENVLNRSDIKKIQSQGQSLMPEGLEAGMAPQDLADLIEYVEAAEGK